MKQRIAPAKRRTKQLENLFLQCLHIESMRNTPCTVFLSQLSYKNWGKKHKRKWRKNFWLQILNRLSTFTIAFEAQSHNLYGNHRKKVPLQTIHFRVMMGLFVGGTVIRMHQNKTKLAKTSTSFIFTARRLCVFFLFVRGGWRDKIGVLFVLLVSWTFGSERTDWIIKLIWFQLNWIGVFL